MCLKNLVLVLFEYDTVISPKETSWFAYFSPGQDKNFTKLEDSVLYQEVSETLIISLNIELSTPERN